MQAFFLWIFLCLAALFHLQPAQAEEAYPARALRIVVPLPAGGPTDFLARAVAQQLSGSLGQAVHVENKPGGEGIIAAKEVMAAAPDGYTLLFSVGSMLALPLQSTPPAFDWGAALAPVGKVARIAFCIAVHPDLPVKSVADLVAHARANPDKLNFSTSTQSELMAASQFMKATGIRMTRVNYKGGAQALPDLLAGRVHVMFGPVALAMPHAKSGALRVLATLLPQRSPALPEVPTLAEAGHAAVAVPTWQALFAPARTPAPAMARLSAELAAVVARPEFRAELEKRAIYPESSSAQELSSTVSSDQLAWTHLIKEFKLGAD